jgi:WD40 repeat protein
MDEIERQTEGHKYHDQEEKTISSLNYSPASQIIVTESRDHTVKVWEKVWEVDTKKLIHVLKGHEDEIWSANFSYDNKRLVTGSRDGMVRVWDVSTGKLIRELIESSWIRYVDFSPDGRCCVAMDIDGNPVWVWNIDTGKLLKNIYFIKFSPNNKWFAVNIRGDNNEEVFQVWNINTWKVFRNYDANILDANFSSDSNKLLVRDIFGDGVWETLEEDPPCLMKYINKYFIKPFKDWVFRS